MFDIGFAELLLIAVVGLLVIGPERLPATIRTVSLWLGRFRRTFNQVRADIEREVGADEVRRQLHNETIMASLKESQQRLKKQLDVNPEPDTSASADTTDDDTTNLGNDTAADDADGAPSVPETTSDVPDEAPAIKHPDDKTTQ